MALVRIEHLKKYFHVSGGTLHAVDDVSLSIEKAETLGIVGESGCGKSTLGKTITRLIEPTEGTIYFQDREIVKLGIQKGPASDADDFSGPALFSGPEKDGDADH